MVVCVLLEMTVPHVNTLPQVTEENDAKKVVLRIISWRLKIVLVEEVEGIFEGHNIFPFMNFRLKPN